ncbi:hypothetical protein [Bradyrhizobium sp. Ai1a-2]|uniref:hypothetical protein n=1 Tax=Bradyrhizobium sp. Ai1a-2 TaxID=196490 RepID=UPI000415CC89|nr:hypothetical protein [Bradyrhizobium sp. Ai1a-2]
MRSRRLQQQLRRVPHLGGTVRVTPVRQRMADEDVAYTVTWHSSGGDLCWLSPRIPSQDAADAAAAVLADFTHAVLAR